MRVSDVLSNIDTDGPEIRDVISDVVTDASDGIPDPVFAVSPSELNGEVEGTDQLTATLDEDDVTAGTTWESSDDLIATVSATGLVTYVEEGTATITATYGTDSAEVPVTVTAP